VPEGSADISSPEVIRQFRHNFVEFDAACREALEGIKADIHKVQEWLKHEQLSHWKQQLRKREEAAEQAKREYARARAGDKYVGQRSSVDEQKALQKALRRKAETEEKIRAVKRWILKIEQEVRERTRPCASLSSLLDTLTPKALARLDQMLDSLDDYLRPSASGPAG